MSAKRENCRTCGRHTDECGQLSRRGYCQPCGQAAAIAAAMQMAAKSGPAYDRWLQTAGPTGRSETPYAA